MKIRPCWDDILRRALKAISVIIVVVSGLVAGQVIAQAADNEGEQGELNEIREQECTNARTDSWGGTSPEQFRKECQQ